MNLSGLEFTRLANNFYTERNIVVDMQRMSLDADLLNYIVAKHDSLAKKFKVAFCYICINPTYWEYVKPMVDGAKQFFLPGHDVDFFFWTDMPKPDDKENLQKAAEFILQNTVQRHAKFGRNDEKQIVQEANDAMNRAYDSVKTAYANHVFPLEPIEWPMPTLMRYHTFLQQEEKLKEYDYIFYCDIDMRFVGVVGDEVLGNGLTAAQHPMYAFDKSFFPPYEPNEKSTAYIPRPGMVINDPQGTSGKRFMPLYFAGGLQGGSTQEWLKAMRTMKKMIDKDMLENHYTAIWNDESYWNAYLFKHPPVVTLSPSYIYPDSLIKEYYEPRWGVSYPPKLVTLTKKSSLVPVNVHEINKFKI